MAHTLKLTQGGADKIDFQASGGNYKVRTFSLRGMGESRATAALVIDILGSSHDDLLDKVIALYRVVQNARINYDNWMEGISYTPIYLQWKPANATNTNQSETWGISSEEQQALENILANPELIMSNRIENIALTLSIRGQMGETSAASITLKDSGNSTITSVTNEMTPAYFSGVRGDLAAFLKVVVRTSIAAQDRVIVGIKSKGTVANFVAKYQGEDASLGSGVSTATAGGAQPAATTNVAQWSPAGSASEQNYATWTISSNVGDQHGSYRVFVRCKDSNKKVSMRVRAGIGSNFAEYGDKLKMVNTANTWSLVDCGIIRLPPFETGGLTPDMKIQLRASASAATTFNLDAIYLMPVDEGGDGSGLVIATFPSDMGTGASPDGVVDSNDTVPSAYLSTSIPASDIRGVAPLALPNTSLVMYVLTMDSGDGSHDFTSTNSLTATYLARYRLGRGS